MLSRYNGIGSLKLGITGAHNQRTSNPYISEVMRTTDITNGHRNDNSDSTYGELTSDCSPMQLKNVGNSMRTVDGKINHHPNNEKIDLNANARFNLSRKKASKNQQKQKPSFIKLNSSGHGRKSPNCIPKIKSTNSIYSTSTISNSSLQEYDDNELDTNELAKNLRKINNDIHHDAK